MTNGIAPNISAGMRPPDGRLRSIGVGAVFWIFVTAATAAQGQLFASYHGHSQNWWGTLGYTAAVFLVWAILTPAVLKAADAIFAARLPRVTRTALWALGYPITTALHVSLFVALFWPVYGANAATPFTMMEPVLLANLDKSAFAYVGLIAFALLSRRLRERGTVERPVQPARTADDGLWIRISGGSHLVRFREIDWIAAAGDYAEVHAAGRGHLTDRSLKALAEQLPEEDFARIHRGTIVRLDRVCEVSRLGRGDARVRLANGQMLRLSRRYRENLAALLPF